MRLDRLTPEQEALIPIVRDEWLQIGLSVEPTDKTAAVAAARLAYAQANLPEPTVFVWLPSPLAGAIAASRLSTIKAQAGAQVKTRGMVQVWDQVRAQVREQVRDQVGDQVMEQVRDQVGAVLAQVGDQVREQVRDQVGDQVRAQVREQVRDQVREQVRDQVGDQVREQVWAQVREQVREQVWAQVGRCGYGLHDANWLSFLAYFGRCGLDVSRADGLAALGRTCGWWWPFHGLCLLTERPTGLSRDARHRLHSASGMAIQYADGWGIWAWHGVRVTEQIIRTPDTLTKEQIAKEQNAQVRQVMVERIGIERVCTMFHAQALETKGEYALLLLDLGDGRKRPYLKMRNPSVGCYHIEGVHPTCTTVQQAINWRAHNEHWQPEVLT